jgi:hypothetical protein
MATATTELLITKYMPALFHRTGTDLTAERNKHHEVARINPLTEAVYHANTSLRPSLSSVEQVPLWPYLVYISM